MSRVTRVIRKERLVRAGLCVRSPAVEGWEWSGGSHRFPPLPHYQRRPVIKGECRICGLPIYTRGRWRGQRVAMRASWHSVCYTAYAFWTSPDWEVMGELQGWRCGGCNKLMRAGHDRRWCPATWSEAVEMDHTMPLYRVWREHRHEPWQALLRFWSPEYVKALCVPCHREKGAQEAAERARWARTSADQLALL